MSRATSASVYGSKPLDDTYRTFAPKREIGLRSESAPRGQYSAGAYARKRRTPGDVRVSVPQHVRTTRAMAANRAMEEDHDAPVARVIRPDYAAERHSVGVIRMGDLD